MLGTIGSTDQALEDGKLADNILYFCRTLRRAGIKVGPASVIQAMRPWKLADFKAATNFTGRFMRSCQKA